MQAGQAIRWISVFSAFIVVCSQVDAELTAAPVYFSRPMHEEDDTEEETVVEDDAELTIDKLNDELAVSFTMCLAHFVAVR